MFKSQCPHEAIILDRQNLTKNIIKLSLQFRDEDLQHRFSYQPGQFNMFYLYGGNEIALSIVSHPEKRESFEHVVRIIGRITQGINLLKKGDSVGIRGPFGNGWPIDIAINKHVVILTGGLGCAPTVSIIDYIISKRSQFKDLYILQGVKHTDDLIFKKQYDIWSRSPNTFVKLSADSGKLQWPWHQGRITDLIGEISLEPKETVVFMCGPEGMMDLGAKILMQRGMSPNNIYLNMERNMECAIGHCGHCQFGGKFICKDGPVLSYESVRKLLVVDGF